MPNTVLYAMKKHIQNVPYAMCIYISSLGREISEDITVF
jgi:hypothetical protein